MTIQPESLVTNAAHRRPNGVHAPAWPPAGGPSGQALYRVLSVHEGHIWAVRIDCDRPSRPFTALAADYVVDESVPSDWSTESAQTDQESVPADWSPAVPEVLEEVA